MSFKINLRATRDEFVKANRHAIHVVKKVELMSEKEFQEFIEPYYSIFNEFVEPTEQEARM